MVIFNVKILIYNIKSNYHNILFYSQNNSNVIDNTQQSHDDLEPTNIDDETPTTSTYNLKKSKWLVPYLKQDWKFSVHDLEMIQ